MNKQPQNLEPVLPIEPHPPIVPPTPLQPLLQQKTTEQIKIPTYRALPHTRRGVVCDFFREKVFNLPKDEPAPIIGGIKYESKPFFIFEKHENGFDFEYLGVIDNPSPLCDRSEAEAAAQKYIKTQNEAWAQYWGFSPSDGQRLAGRNEPFLPLFDDFLELQDCYAVYHPNFEGYILYWQVNYRVMLPSVSFPSSGGQRGKSYRAAVQGEYVRIGIYNDRAARTMQFRHFAVEEVGREPYFFSPKEEVQAAQNVINTPTPLAKTAQKTAVLPAVPTDTKDAEDLLLQTHEALFFKKVGDGYAASGATPQGEVAASKSGGRGEEDAMGLQKQQSSIKNNIILMVLSTEEAEQTYQYPNQIEGKFSSDYGDWHIITDNHILTIEQELSKYLAGNRIKNLLLRAHGSLDFPAMLLDLTPENKDDKNLYSSLTSTDAVAYLKEGNTVFGEEYSKQSKKHKEYADYILWIRKQFDALKKIISIVENDGNIVLTNCDLARIANGYDGIKLSEALLSFNDNDITLYCNRDESTRYSKDKKISFGEYNATKGFITDIEKFNLGWHIFEKKEGKIEHKDTHENLFLNSFGEPLIISKPNPPPKQKSKKK